jgi:hypothetical protein
MFDHIGWITNPVGFLLDNLATITLEAAILSFSIPYVLHLIQCRKFAGPRLLLFQFLVRNVANKFSAYSEIANALFRDRDYALAARQYYKAVEMRTLTDRYIGTLSFALDENFAAAMPTLVRRRERRLRMLIYHAIKLSGRADIRYLDLIPEPEDSLYEGEIGLADIAKTMTSWAEEISSAVRNLEERLRAMGYKPKVPIQSYALVDELRTSKSVNALSENLVKLAKRVGNDLQDHEHGNLAA